MIQVLRTGLTALGAMGALTMMSSPITGAMDMSMAHSSSSNTKIYKANLAPLNGSGAHGTAMVITRGNQATVIIKSSGLSANLPHAQHIHIGGNHLCPTLADDANSDGLISTSEGMNAYGDALVGLTTTGDVSVNSELAVDRYPVATNDGTVTYQRTFTLPSGVTPADVAGGVVVQHGDAAVFNDPTMYDGTAKDVATSPTLPLEATIPADCGVLKNVTPMAMSGNENQATFDASITGAENALAAVPTNGAQVASTFRDAYSTATDQFNQALSTAHMRYSTMMTSDPAGARNAYIDAFNHAKSDYLGSLETARNNVVNSLSGVNDVAKDMFVNAFNTARDSYSNQLEMVKNQI